ncbi:hypothetical protein [Microseira wollei]|uniref:hypothetical protein n=1 Tax=Microseira wollei TaxID=467598 RepID=UPI001CFE4986|nr:hypothetical protein [Microseira wollei]
MIPKRVWTIPAKNSQAENPVEIGIRITNKTQAPVRFTGFDPLEVIKLGIERPDGLVLGTYIRRAIVFGNSREYPQHNYNCQLVLPGKSLTFFPEAKLFWEDEQLTLGEPDRKGSRWFIKLPEVGTYKVRFIYNNPSPGLAVEGCFDPNAVSRTYIETGL